jgi:hypothetical protein
MPIETLSQCLKSSYSPFLNIPALELMYLLLDTL